MKVISTAFPLNCARSTLCPSEFFRRSAGAGFGGAALAPANEALFAFVWPLGTPVLEPESPELPQPATSNAPTSIPSATRRRRRAGRPAVLREGVIAPEA